MTEDALKLIVGGTVSIIFIAALIPVFFTLTSALTAQQCQSYISQIAQKDAQITGLTAQNQQLSDDLQKTRAEYNRLITENITKHDIEELKQDMNFTQTNINTLNQRFDAVNNNFVNVYQNLYVNYWISIVINVVLVISVVFFIVGDIISASVFKFDIKQQAFTWVINNLKKVKKIVKELAKNEDEHAGV